MSAPRLAASMHNSLKLLDGPRFPLSSTISFMRLSCSWNVFRMCTVPSEELSSRTSRSQFLNVWAWMLWICSSRKRSPLYVPIRIVTRQSFKISQLRSLVAATAGRLLSFALNRTGMMYRTTMIDSVSTAADAAPVGPYFGMRI